MANLNKVLLIGRLTRDPEPILVSGQTSGAKFGFVVNNRKQNRQTGQWEDTPVWIDCEIWNRGENKQAERVLNSLRKGSQIHIEGHLKLDEWLDKNGGGKRSKLGVVVDAFQYLDPRPLEEVPVTTTTTPSTTAESTTETTPTTTTKRAKKPRVVAVATEADIPF
jgi:single-strand DNA-binding protein